MDYIYCGHTKQIKQIESVCRAELSYLYSSTRLRFHKATAVSAMQFYVNPRFNIVYFPMQQIITFIHASFLLYQTQTSQHQTLQNRDTARNIFPIELGIISGSAMIISLDIKSMTSSVN